MGAGKYNQQITLMIPAISRGADGSAIETFMEYATVWAAKQHKTSREFFSASKINAETTDLFIVRYRDLVTTTMQVVHRGRTYDIIGADDPDGSRKELWLLCKVVS